MHTSRSWRTPSTGWSPSSRATATASAVSPLARIAAEFCDTVAVGTIHELDGLPDGLHSVVLTPTLVAPESTAPILTVGSRAHIDALTGWHGRVLVKLESSMHRYGGGVALVDDARRAGLDVIGVSLHPPLAGSPSDHAAEVRGAIEHVDPGLTVWVSHLDPATYATLPSTHTYRLRLGTSLWHGDKSLLQLSADVLDIRAIRAGTPSRLPPAPRRRSMAIS